MVCYMLMICVVTIIAIWLFCIGILCKLLEKIDIKRFRREQAWNEKMKGKTNYALLQQETSKVTIKSLVYQVIMHYGYGFVRWSFLICCKFPSNRIRRIVFKFVFGAKITKNTVIAGNVEIRSPWNLCADRCTIMNGCILDARHGIQIGQDVVFGTGVNIWTEEHDLNDPYFAVSGDHAKSVKIGNHAWICSDSTILPGVEIGEGAVVATRACITKNCDDFYVYGGVPAKKISERNRNLLYRLNGKPHWHFY